MFGGLSFAPPPRRQQTLSFLLVLKKVPTAYYFRFVLCPRRQQIPLVIFHIYSNISNFFGRLGSFQPIFRGLARVLGDGHVLLKFVFKSVPKPIGQAWALPSSIFEVRLPCLVQVNPSARFVFKSVLKLMWTDWVPSKLHVRGLASRFKFMWRFGSFVVFGFHVSFLFQEYMLFKSLMFK